MAATVRAPDAKNPLSPRADFKHSQVAVDQHDLVRGGVQDGPHHLKVFLQRGLCANGLGDVTRYQQRPLALSFNVSQQTTPHLNGQPMSVGVTRTETEVCQLAIVAIEEFAKRGDEARLVVEVHEFAETVTQAIVAWTTEDLLRTWTGLQYHQVAVDDEDGVRGGFENDVGRFPERHL